MNDPHPQSYASASATPKFERPVAVSIPAFLGIVVGSLFLFCNVILMVSNAIMLKHPERSSPGQGMAQEDPMVIKFGVANAVLGVIFFAILLGGSLAAVNLRKQARHVMLIWSIGFIFCGVARTVGEIKYVGPANIEWVRKNKPDEPSFASGQMEAMLVPKAVGALALYLVLPAMFLGLWTRKDVIDAFERGGY